MAKEKMACSETGCDTTSLICSRCGSITGLVPTEKRVEKKHKVTCETEYIKTYEFYNKLETIDLLDMLHNLVINKCKTCNIQKPYELVKTAIQPKDKLGYCTNECPIGNQMLLIGASYEPRARREREKNSSNTSLQHVRETIKTPEYYYELYKMYKKDVKELLISNEPTNQLKKGGRSKKVEMTPELEAKLDEWKERKDKTDFNSFGKIAKVTITQDRMRKPKITKPVKPKKPNGRPKKVVEPKEKKPVKPKAVKPVKPKAVKPPKEKKPIGRPRKIREPKEKKPVGRPKVIKEPAPPKVKKPIGRPRKIKEPKEKKPLGRPRIIREPVVKKPKKVKEVKVKRPVGRPRKPEVPKVKKPIGKPKGVTKAVMELRRLNALQQKDTV
jgi:hypothetical protein